MNIQKWYEGALSIKSNWLKSIVYKVNKAIVNIIYPYNYKCSYGLDYQSKFIISLTSWTARIDKVHVTIATLLNQRKKPYKVILWLSREEFPNAEKDLPSKLLQLKKYGLEIQFCENIKSHKKYYYAVKDYENYSIITVDDDVLYPENMTEKLVNLSECYPGVVCCNWCHHFVLDEDGDVFSYAKWKTERFSDVPTMACIPVGIGGVLYPPGALHSEVLNIDAIKETCITADDLWLKAMEVYAGTKAIRTEGQEKIFFTQVATKKSALYHVNVEGNKSEESWRNIMEKYPEIRNILIEEIQKETLQ